MAIIYKLYEMKFGLKQNIKNCLFHFNFQMLVWLLMTTINSSKLLLLAVISGSKHFYLMSINIINKI